MDKNWNDLNRDGGSSSATAFRPQARGLLIALLLILLAAPWHLKAAETATGSTKFIPTFLIYYGGGRALVASDVPTLAKFDLIDIDRFRYDNIGPNTWAAIKAINPDVQIYLYQMGPEAPNFLDSTEPLYLNGLGRYNVSRGHFMGSLNGNHPELFLLDWSGNRIYNKGFSNTALNRYWHLMDFGSSAYQSYWVTATKADIVDQPWVADGVFVDNCVALSRGASFSGTSTRYSTDAAWSGAMNSFVEAITTGMHGYGQKLWCNRLESRMPNGSAAWLALDNAARPPDVVLEEGAFAIPWGAHTWFYQEQEWKLQIDTLAAIRNSKVAMLSHTQLEEGQWGTDNWGKPVSFGQTLWYALGSFLLTKNDNLGNAYFMFQGGSAFNQIRWFEEYDKIDLGKALGAYRVTSIGGVNVYWREFERGYVYVNPTPHNVSSITLPQASRLLTRATLHSLLDALPLVSTIPLNGNHAAFLFKTLDAPAPGADTSAPSVPTGLVGVPVSSSQINLSWNASTDNVGVTGYYVYLNDTALATTTATSFTHSGLTAGTTYNYRVSAYDAVPNHSAWTATPIAVTTLSASAPMADTQAPTVPAGLAGVAVSSSQLELSWTASTDNVGVTGYYVYLNDKALATTTATSFTHSGLTAGATYNYRVSAYDAVPNHSAWTPTPVAVTTLATAPDTQAPAVPTGLVGVAVSSTEISLSWNASTDNVGVTGYYVYLNDHALATTTATSFTHRGLTAGATYNYRVSAYDAVPNHSAWTPTPIAVTTLGTAPDTQAPTVPTGLVGVAVSSSQINLSWNASTDNVGVTGYYVYLNNKPLATTTATSFTHSGLTADTTYKYRVSAYDAVPNHSAWTATPVAVTTLGTAPDTQAPTVPTGLVGVAVSSSEISLSWNGSTDNVGVAGYYVYLNNHALATTTATSFTHSGLTAGATYNYRVSAYDAVPNHSAWTATPVAVTTPLATAPDTQAPAVPTGLVGVAVSSTEISLSWNASTDNVGVTGYYVYLNDKALATTTATSFTHRGLTAGATYNYRVSAYDAVPNHSAWTPTPIAVTTLGTAPDTQAPTVPTGLVGVAVSSTEISLSWNASTDNVGVTGYYVYLNDHALATTTATSFTHRGLTAGATYNYRVSASDAVPNHSAWTPTPVAVTTPGATPSP